VRDRRRNEAVIDRREFLRVSALISAMVATPGWAQALARVPANDWAAVRALLADYVASKKTPGLVGAVARGAGSATFVAQGTLATDSTVPITADSLFRVYSMTKPITAMAAMLLVEDGKIGLDQPVGDFIRGFAKPMVAIDPQKSLDARPASRPFTIRHLMTHSGGLGYIITSKGALLDAYRRLGLIGGLVSERKLPGITDIVPAPDLKSFADRIATLPLMYEPDTRWSYSAGPDVLGRVIEIASGMAFEAFLNARLFGPLGMNSTFFVVPKSELGRMTTNYGIAFGRKIVLDPGATTIFAKPNPLPLGGGGLVMSARDYDRFLAMLGGYGALGNVRVMKEATARLAMSNLLAASVVTTATSVAGQGFGAGGRVRIEGPGIGTFGWGGAAATVAWVDAARGIRASGYAQYMPSEAIPFSAEFTKSVIAGL